MPMEEKMRIKKIRRMIEKALDDEDRKGQLANLLRQLAHQNGAAPSPAEINGAVAFVREYVEHVPMYLEQAHAAAKQVGLANEIAQMTSELESYWFEKNDVIPDHHGLVGIMDDAYASLLLLQSVSDYCQTAAGRPLLQQNLTQANAAIHTMIGEPAASHLAQLVGVTVANAMMQRVMGQIASSGAFSFGAGPDPIWGNASVDEIVNTKLGAMGVV